MAVFLGIDIGTSATKTLAIDERGTILAEASSSYQVYLPRPTWSEQNPDDWWTATVATVQEVMQRGQLNAADVKAIGLSGQMHGAVFLDKDDRVVRPAILWNDQRTTAECDEIESKCQGREGLVNLVANRAITGFTAPKILWLRNREPENFERTRKILLPKDEVRRRLTGEYATDVSDASGVLLFDVAARKWSDRLLSLLDLDKDLLPRCFESPEVTGQLTKSSAELLGLSQDCLVVGGAGDCAACAVGNGIVYSGVLSTSLGTSGVMMAHSEACHVDPEGRIHTICSAVPGGWLLTGVNLSAGGCLQWFRDQLCRNGKAERLDADIYSALDAEAANVPAGSQGLIFLPYLSGERTPHFDADARGCFIGLTLAHTRAHMARAVMEGVTFNLAETLEIIRSRHVPVNEIRASGGGSRSQLWRQIQASVFGQSVSLINAEQGPSYGVALLAAVGAGAFASVQEACNATIRVSGETQFDSADSRHYALIRPTFRRLYDALKGEFKQMAALESARLAVEMSPALDV
jgi:xylulokinase